MSLEVNCKLVKLRGHLLVIEDMLLTLMARNIEISFSEIQEFKQRIEKLEEDYNFGEVTSQ